MALFWGLFKEKPWVFHGFCLPCWVSWTGVSFKPVSLECLGPKGTAFCILYLAKILWQVWPKTQGNKHTLQGTITYPTLGKGKSSTQKCLGMGYVSSQEGIPLGGNKSDNIWTENSSFGATGFDLLSWMRKFYIPILHLMYTVHVGRKMCVSSKDSSWTYWDHILQWDIYALTQITKTSTTRFGSQSKIPNIQIAFSLFLTGKVSQLKNISTSQLSKYYNRQEFEIACAICAWISAPSRAESGTVLDRTSATQYP